MIKTEFTDNLFDFDIYGVYYLIGVDYRLTREHAPPYCSVFPPGDRTDLITGLYMVELLEIAEEVCVRMLLQLFKDSFYGEKLWINKRDQGKKDRVPVKLFPIDLVGSQNTHRAIHLFGILASEELVICFSQFNPSINEVCHTGRQKK